MAVTFKKGSTIEPAEGCAGLGMLFWIFWILGSLLCIWKLLHCDFQAPWKAEILYAIGIFTPLGGLLGWFNFGK